MSYTPINWNNDTTPINETNLNKMDQAIAGLSDEVDAVEEQLSDKVLSQYKQIALSASGWYRIAEFNGNSEPSVIGSWNNGCDIDIRKAYNNTQTENHSIRYRANNSNANKFLDEVSCGLVLNVQKIRFGYDTTTFKGFIEVYYNANNRNYYGIYLSNQYGVLEPTKCWNLIDPIATEETVDGFTVVTTHEFSLNKSYESEIALKRDITLMTLSNGDVLDTTLKNGHYYCGGAKNVPTPSITSGYLDVEARTPTYRKVTWKPYDRNEVYENTCVDGTWKGWTQLGNQSDIDAIKYPVKLFDVESNTYSAGDYLGGDINMSLYSGFIIKYSTVQGGYYKTSVFTGVNKADYQWLDFVDSDGTVYCAGIQVRPTGGLFVERVGENKPYITALYGIPA